MSRKFIMVVWLFFVSICVHAISLSTYRQTITSAVGEAMNRYHRNFPDVPLTDLSDIVGKNYLPVEDIEHNLKMPFTNVFVMVKSNFFPVPAPYQGQVVVVMTTVSIDARHGTDAVRNVVFRDPDGIFRSRTVSESALQAEAAKVGFQLPNFGVVQEDIPDGVVKNLTNAPTPVAVPVGQGTKAPDESIAPKGDPNNPQPKLSVQKDPGHSGIENNQPKVSNSVALPVAIATPASGTGWLGLIVVLGMGLLFSIFLLFRAKQK